MQRHTGIKAIALPMRGARTFAVRYPISAAWAIVAALIILMAIAAPLVSPRDPLKLNIVKARSSPDAANPFGTDDLGRDTLSRIIHGSRISLFVGFASVLLGTTAGAIVGLAGGYIGGKLDLFTQRLLEMLQSFPDLILALAFSMAMGAGMWTVIFAIALTRISYGGRVIRSVALTVKEMSYVEAAHAIGASPLRIMALHIAPQCVAPFVVLATMHLGVAILIESSLGFLGVGIPPPAATWGNMLGEAAKLLMPRWWMVLFPGLAITLAVLAFNLVGDGIRDALDPRLRGT